jgi:DMSO/TMAO reductase YedYZ heme-binding membrane subunit
MANRRYLGLSVAASHLWHLAAIVAFLVQSPTFRDGVQMQTIVFGGSGFVLIALMAATSNDVSQRALGRGWSVLHTVGLYVVWIDFIYTYMGAAASSPFQALMTAAFAAAWGLRVFAWAAARPVVSRA